jgi:hypothetical protein
LPRAGSHVQAGGGAGGGSTTEERGNLQGIGQLNQFPTAYSRHDSFLAMQVCRAVGIVTARARYSFACNSFAVPAQLSSGPKCLVLVC